MKRLFIGTILAAVAATVASSCRGDPTASLRTGLKSIAVNPSLVFMSEGDVKAITATPQDDQLNPVSADVTANSQDQAVATVAENPDAPSPTNSEASFAITAVAPGRTTVDFSSGGVTGSAVVNVLPLGFGGTVSTATPQVGQELTIAATNVLKFTDTSNVRFGVDPVSEEPILGLVTSHTAESLTVIVPMVPTGGGVQPQTLDITNINVSYVPGLIATLTTPDKYDVQNPYDPNDSPDPAYTLTIPAAGSSTVLYDGFTSQETDNFYTINLAAATTFTVTMEWDTDADLDILWCDAGCNAFVGNFSGATGANPESSQVTLGPGSYNLWINVYDSADQPVHLYKLTISNP